MKKETIFIIENSNSPHEEGLETLTKVIKFHNINVVLCLNKISHKRVINLGLEEVVDGIILLDSIKSIVTLIVRANNEGGVIFSTVSIRNAVFSFLVGMLVKRSVYFIRNANSWLFYSNHKGLFHQKLLRYTSTTLKKIMLYKCKYLIVESDQIKKYLSNYTAKRIEVVPYKYFSSNNISANKQSKTLTYVVLFSVNLSHGQNLEEHDVTEPRPRHAEKYC